MSPLLGLFSTNYGHWSTKKSRRGLAYSPEEKGEKSMGLVSKEI